LRLLNYKTTLLLAGILTCGFSAQASTVNITFLGTSGVSDGADYVTPYQLSINGTATLATCYDIFDTVTQGQSWTANAFTLSEAAASGQFSGDTNAFARYEDVAFLSMQKTFTAQNQIDLQHNIWNVFAPGTYAVNAGMQTYLNLLTTSSFTSFDFSKVLFLEDVSQSPRAQAFVIDPPSAVPEPGTIVLAGAGVLLVGLSSIRKRQLKRVAVTA
jgi:hypothetical protein